VKTSLDCIPCFVRQALYEARIVSADAAVHERMVREVLLWAGEMSLEEPPVRLGTLVRRRLRELTGVADPYRVAKDHQNQMAQNLLSELRKEIEAAPDPLAIAVRLAIAGNVIDMGVNGNITEADVRRSIQHALAVPFFGGGFRWIAASCAHHLHSTLMLKGFGCIFFFTCPTTMSPETFCRSSGPFFCASSLRRRIG
jgi:uncharacterized protein with ATP-grasp and redox domains